MEKVICGFSITEFVPPEIYNVFGVNSWWFIDEKLPIIASELKKDCGGASVTINNWAVGGVRKYSGYRPITCKIGSDNSQHRHGRGFDALVDGYTADQVRDIILKNEKKYLALGLTRLEDKAFAPTWTHIDVAWTGLDCILIVKPMK